MPLWGTAGAGMDSAWEQKKLEARNMLENAAESPASSARCGGQLSAFVFFGKWWTLLVVI